MFKSSFYFFILCLFTVQSVFAAVESSESIKENSHHISTHQLHDQSHQHGYVDSNQHDQANTDLAHDHQQTDHESCHAHFHFHPTMLTELVRLNPSIHQQEVITARKLATEQNITSLYRPPIA
ncbi:hypothetical protein [Thalassotalea sp. ND16A]|uniref:hypothetical protein n=1 Tax=Thalassotalea sp. ND16A TaxID=1535422 RepID=UPI00051A6B73|nr:hypothetical protein [Thalassotalea sp. ND16A]KGK00179.1 hypothetical protein ND16A_3650 [Thalassotalea sp. ND16A]